MSRLLRVMIVDDEDLARARLRRLLREQPDVVISAECASGRSAIEAAAVDPPDVVLLDVQMPGGDGFSVIASLPAPAPLYVMVTAYHDHAVRAFEAHAFDYLLKPVEGPRLLESLGRARERLENERVAHRLAELGAVVRSEGTAPRRLVVREGGRVSFVAQRDIVWIEARGNYVRIHTARGYHLLREPLGSIERRLDPSLFCRVHRSTIVNLQFVEHLEAEGPEAWVVALSGGQRLRLSKYYRDRLEPAVTGHPAAY